MPRVYYAFLDGILMVAFFKLILAIIAGIREEFGDDSVGDEILKFSQEVSKKVANEHNLYQNTIGAIKTEPAFFSYSTRLASDINDLLMGDKTIQKALSSNVRMFEMIDPDL